jgi:ubiquinone/menaquinone biosynthesis C-methylase UbiE
MNASYFLRPSRVAAAALLSLCSTAPVFSQEERRVPYVPSPNEVVEAMLKLGEVKPNDVLYDLGCGDGRIVVTAAQKYGSRGVGVDIDPQRIKESNENAQKAGVANKVKFVQQDLFATDLREASVVTLYLLPDFNMRLRPKLLKELKPGTRIVSHTFDMGDWQPDKTVKLDYRTIYMWTVTDKAKAMYSNTGTN